MRSSKGLLAVLVLAWSTFAAAQGPDIRVIDNKVSIKANAIPMGRLLHLLDFATGMTSKVPAEFSNKNVSVQFADLDIDMAVRKIFEGQSMDYIFVEGQGITVTAASLPGASAPASNAPAQFPRDPSPFETAPGFPQPDQNQGFAPDPLANPGAILNNGGQTQGNVIPQQGQQQQPAVIQTPFGPIANPRFNQGQPGQQNGAPLSGPGATNPFGSPFGVLPQPTNPFGGATSPTASPSPGISLPIAPIATPPLVPTQQPPTKP
jgi:hypothetical protein